MAPGGEVTFNVPIRTVTLAAPSAADPATDANFDSPNAPRSWRARCGIGSGITLDATAQAEAREWHHKQAFLRRAAQPFELLESLRLDHGQMARLDAHLRRLQRAARHFGFPLDDDAVRQALDALVHTHPTGAHKVRLRVDAHGQVLCEASALAPTAMPIRVALAHQAMPPGG